MAENTKLTTSRNCELFILGAPGQPSFWMVVQARVSVFKKIFTPQAVPSGTKRYEAVHVRFPAGSTGQKTTVKPSNWCDSV
jgi:hypothetical protein